MTKKKHLYKYIYIYRESQKYKKKKVKIKNIYIRDNQAMIIWSVVIAAVITLVIVKIIKDHIETRQRCDLGTWQSAVIDAADTGYII